MPKDTPMTDVLFRYAALFCFSAASFGFVYFLVKYRRGSQARLWGIRICHSLGFTGVLMHRLWLGEVNEISLLMVSSLTVSLLGFELSERYLN